MNDPEPDFKPQADGQLRVCKIIAGALIGGVSTFLAIVVSLRLTGGKGFLAAKPWDVPPGEAIISLVAVAMALTMVVLAPVVARSMTAKFRAQLAAGKPLNPESAGLGEQGALRVVYQFRMIVSLAMLEGAGFFNLIAFLLEGRLPTLIATLVLIAVMVLRFPSRSALDAFVDEQSDLLGQERQSV